MRLTLCSKSILAFVDTIKAIIYNLNHKKSRTNILDLQLLPLPPVKPSRRDISFYKGRTLLCTHQDLVFAALVCDRKGNASCCFEHIHRPELPKHKTSGRFLAMGGCIHREGGFDRKKLFLTT